MTEPGPEPTPPVVPPVNSTPKWLGVIAGGLLVLGAFLPWVTIGIIAMAGTRGDGVLTLVAGVAIAALAWFRPASKATGVGILLLSIFSSWVAFTAFTNLSASVGEETLLGTTEIGTGLMMTLAGAGLGVFAGIVTIAKAGGEKPGIIIPQPADGSVPPKGGLLGVSRWAWIAGIGASVLILAFLLVAD